MRPADADHPAVAAAIDALGELGKDGLLSAAGLASIDAVLAPLQGEALADAAWNLLVFSSFLGATPESEAFGFQLLELVERAVARLPAPLQAGFDAGRAAAQALGASTSLRPVGGPAPAGSVKGGLAARLSGVGDKKR